MHTDETVSIQFTLRCVSLLSRYTLEKISPCLITYKKIQRAESIAWRNLYRFIAVGLPKV